MLMKMGIIHKDLYWHIMILMMIVGVRLGITHRDPYWPGNPSANLVRFYGTVVVSCTAYPMPIILYSYTIHWDLLIISVFGQIMLNKVFPRETCSFYWYTIYCFRNPSPLPSSSGNAHANLMAAIRSAGGAGKAKLKSTATSTPDKVSNFNLFNFLHN